VCSGCSGDYAGDFEDSDEMAGDSADRQGTWAQGHPETNENRWRTQGAGSFEARPSAESDSQFANPEGSKGQSAGEIYEIMVSGTRIVEIRIVEANFGAQCGANYRAIHDLRDAKAAELPARHKDSKAGSAKYYQTRGVPAEGASDGVQGFCCGRIAVMAAGQVNDGADGRAKRWGRWARNAMRKLCSKNRCASRQESGGDMEGHELEAPQAPTQPMETQRVDHQDAEAQRAEAYAVEGYVFGVQADGISLEEDETQLAAIRELMMRAFDRGVWLTLGEIAAATEFGEASISAQLRHLRKTHHGGYRVEKRRRWPARPSAAAQKIHDARRGPVIWEYHVLPPA
jgi:hypothetical protein